MSEFEFEPLRGLPGYLPPGETLLWQGSPAWRSIAGRVLHLRALTLYFAAIVLLRAVSGWLVGQSAQTVGVGVAWLVVLGVATVGFLAWVARLIARGTIYSVTTQRVVMRFGMVVPMSINIPFKVVRCAQLRTYADGTGDIPLRLGGDGRIAYPHLWPHAKPWVLRHPEPMLRGITHAQTAATILVHALEQASV